MKEKLKIEYVNIEKLKPWDKNPKRHDDSAIEASLEKFGFADIILVQKDTNRIIAGHGRIKAAKKKGITEVPVVYLDMTDAEANAYAIVHNQTTILKGWDTPKLDEALHDLRIALPDFSLDVFGFHIKSETKEDEPPPVPTSTTSERGDIWQCGEHKIMCGDASCKEDMDKLMAGKKADLVFTDPPYGVSYGAKNRFLNSFQRAGRNINDIANDTISKDDLFKMLNAAFLNIHANISDHASVYVTAPQNGEPGLMMLLLMMMSNLPVRHILIWKKNTPNFSLGRLDYEYQHEPILYTWKKTHRFYAKSERSVWEIDKPRHAGLHPTMKPVELVARAINNSSRKGELVLDPFLGSGTTIIAAEQTERICYGMEICPNYVDVCVKRWEKLTGRNAIRV